MLVCGCNPCALFTVALVPSSGYVPCECKSLAVDPQQVAALGLQAVRKGSVEPYCPTQISTRTGHKCDIICTTRSGKSKTDDAPCVGSTYLADVSRKPLRAALVSKNARSAVLHFSSSSHTSSTHIVLSLYRFAPPVSTTAPSICVTTACLARVFSSRRPRTVCAMPGVLQALFCSVVRCFVEATLEHS